MVNIIESNLKPVREIRKNMMNSCIIIDHTGEKYSDIYELDTLHKEQGKAMFTHHYLVKKNGYIFRGREEEFESQVDDKFNFNVIGIMVEGDFNKENMSEVQLNNLMALIQSITKRNKYILNNIFIHSEVKRETTSPGRLFPYIEFKNRLLQNYISLSTNFMNVRGEVVYALGSRTLEYRIPQMKGDDIYALKLNLIEIGCNIKNINNVFDTELENQIRLLQKKFKLYDNGIVDEKFYKLLDELTFKEGIDRSQLYKKYLKLSIPEITGEDVKLIKSKLHSLNLYKGDINDICDEGLKEAVIAFQERNKISSLNGEVGPLTFHAIMNSEDYSFRRVLELIDPIMQGADVQIIQEMLFKKGYMVDINGYYDTKTHNAICQYQWGNNYLVDGKVDEELFNQILS